MKSSRAFSPSPVNEAAGSHRIRLGICGGVLLALVAIALSGLSRSGQVLAILLVLVDGGRELYRAWSGSRGHLCQVRVSRDGQLLCAFAPETSVLVPVTVRHWWTVCDRVTGLVVEREGGRCSRTILFRDLLAPDQWRRLNVCLRIGRA